MDMLSGILTPILSFVVCLGVVVFVHEWGHFIIARVNGVRIEVFSLGFGPELFGYTAKKTGTRWKVCALPLGGYVKMMGESEQKTDENGEPVDDQLSAEEKKHSFQHKSVGQRAAIVAAGPGINFLFAIAVMTGLYLAEGRVATPNLVGGIQPGSPAAEVGLKEGDRIVAMNGWRITRFEDIQRVVPLLGVNEIEIEAIRDGARLTFVTQPRIMQVETPDGTKIDRLILGISSPRLGENESRMTFPGFTDSIGFAVIDTISVLHSSVVGIAQMVQGDRSTDELGGPIRIAQYSAEAAEIGLITFVMFMAIISVSLGLINLFPIPMLDGGHLLFYAIEWVRGRPLHPRTQEMGMKIGFVLILALMVFATRNDIVTSKWFS